MDETYNQKMVIHFHPAALMGHDAAALKLYMVLASVSRGGVVQGLSRRNLATLLGYESSRSIDVHMQYLIQHKSVRVERVINRDGGHGPNRYVILPLGGAE